MDTKQLSINEKIKNIENSEKFDDLKTGWFPQAASTSYYFVSYCHKDYKKVFIDILRMQQYDSGMAFWYDSKLTVGRDWEKEAKMHINDYDCLGVIFYISENSIKSPAIFKEIQMAIDGKKHFIPILLPHEYLNDKKNEYLCGADLFDELYPNLTEVDEKYKLYHEKFHKDITYLKITDSPQKKTEKIKDSLKREPLLENGYNDEYINNEKKDVITAVNNIDVIEVNESDFRFFNEHNELISISKIGKCAFSNCRYLEKIELSKTITEIGKYAFYNCKKLKTIIFSNKSIFWHNIADSTFMNCESVEDITLPDSIIDIGCRAFSGCKSLKSIFIPNSVRNIGSRAFERCTSLTNISIPNSVKSIEEYAFYGCSSLTSVTVEKGNPKYHSSGNCLIETNSKTLIIGCNTSEIPSDGSVKNIGSHAFFNCTSLTNISIPNCITNIWSGAFEGCSSLKSIEIPNSVKSIEKYAFAGCRNLKSITIHSGVKCIEEYAFADCRNLKSITIHNGVKSIEYRAFAGCFSLPSIEIPNSVKSIKEYAFAGCRNLKSITIHNGVKSIGDFAFSNCTSLTSVTVEKGNPKYHSSGNCLIETNSKTLIIGCNTSEIPSDGSVKNIGSHAFFNCTSLTNISIPNCITNIWSGAFEGCSSLKSISVSNNITNILLYVFKGCSNLTRITIPNSVNFIDSGAFIGCSSLSSIVFNGTKTQWLAIKKYPFWNNATGDYTVYCTDGNLTKAES